MIFSEGKSLEQLTFSAYLDTAAIYGPVNFLNLHVNVMGISNLTIYYKSSEYN